MRSCHNVCDALHYLLDTIYKIWLKIEKTNDCRYSNCAHLAAGLVLFCYGSVLVSLSDNNQVDVIEHFTLPQYICMACLILIGLVSNKGMSDISHWNSVK